MVNFDWPADFTNTRERISKVMPGEFPISRGGPPRLLIVDDSPTALRLLKAIFQDDYDVVTATDGVDGLAKVHHTRPDVIITDSVMPGLDGFALLAKIRENPATDKIPVIILTGEDPRHAPPRDEGDPRPDALLLKSANPEPLMAEVARVLKGRFKRG